MAQELDPRVRRFQEIKARRRREAIARVEKLKAIKAQTPTLTDKQVEQIYAAHIEAQRRTSRINIRGHFIMVTRA